MFSWMHFRRLAIRRTHFRLSMASLFAVPEPSSRWVPGADLLTRLRVTNRKWHHFAHLWEEHPKDSLGDCNYFRI